MTSLDPDPMRERSEPALSTHRCLRGGIAQNKNKKEKKQTRPLGRWLQEAESNRRLQGHRPWLLPLHHPAILGSHTRGEEWYEPLSVVLGDGNAF